MKHLCWPEEQAVLMARLRAKYVKVKTECWLWLAGRNGDGYGCAYRRGVAYGAHRLMYEAFFGPVPRGLELDHLCRIRRCVNPAHLEAVKHIENVRRGDLRKINASKTHCPKGHPYSGSNLYVHPGGRRRSCRLCGNAADARYRARVRTRSAGFP